MQTGRQTDSTERYTHYGGYTAKTLKRVELHLLPNFVEIAQTAAEIWRFFIFQDGGRPPSWIGFTHVGTTHEEYLVVLVTVQNLVVISAEISTVCKF